MAFASTISGYAFIRGKKVTYGKWTTDTTGGDIDTGLLICDLILLQPTGSTVSADHATVNEDLPVAGNAVTIVCTSAIPGDWIAFGS